MPAPPAPSTGPATPRAREIADVAAGLFAARGYPETSIRDVAAAAGMRSASLYYHFANKEEILFAIAHGLMEDFVAEVTPRLAEALDPAAAIESVVGAHLRFDRANRARVLVSARERLSLPPERQRPINRLRARHRDAVAATIADGVAMRSFDVDDPRIAANALLDLLSGVKAWYHPGRHGGLEAMVGRYRRFALALLGDAGGRSA